MGALPQNLAKECQKAEKILKSFMEPSRSGLDGVIPRDVLANAKGFCIFTVVKAGFVFSARAGSGIVIARLPDGSWSAPSAIGTAGMGFGGQAGAEMTEFLIVLNSQSALKSFMSAGSLTIGGNLSVAVGPLGRNGELSGSLNTKGKVAAMYSYSKTKGLFGGISIEGSVILERQDANRIAYEDDYVTSKKLLMGGIPAPIWASGLIEALDRATGDIVKGWIQEDGPERAQTPDEYAFGSASGSGGVVSAPRPKLKSSFFGSSNSIKKTTGSPSSTPPPRSGTSSPMSVRSRKRSNAADRYLETPRKSYEGGIASQKDDNDNIVADDEPPSAAPWASFQPSTVEPAEKRRATPEDDLFNNAFSRLDVQHDEFRGSRPKFQTHFDSDFNPNAPTSPTHRRQSSSVSSNAYSSTGSHTAPHIAAGSGSSWVVEEETTILPASPASFGRNPHHSRSASSYSNRQSKEDDDPFGIFAEPPSQAPLPPNLAYNARLASSKAPTKNFASMSYDRFTPLPLTSASGMSSPNSPTFSSYGVRNGGGGLTSPKPIRSMTREYDDGIVRAVALYDYMAQESGDLGFKKGDVIVVTQKSETADDWWTGRIDGPIRREGIFPANFVDVL